MPSLPNPDPDEAEDAALPCDVRREAAHRGPARIVVGHGATVLGQIQGQDVGLVLWCRQLPLWVEEALQRLDLGTFTQLSIVGPPHAVAAAVAEALQGLPGVAGGLVTLLRRDLLVLARRFTALAGSRSLRLRLEAVDHDACRLFHLDAVPLRLVTTYRGPGTEYLPSTAVSLDGGEVRLAAEQRRQVATGWVALFKGFAWPDATAPLILHRSPPMAGSGETRLVLVLDAA